MTHSYTSNQLSVCYVASDPYPVGKEPAMAYKEVQRIIAMNHEPMEGREVLVHPSLVAETIIKMRGSYETVFAYGTPWHMRDLEADK